ncbi:mitotic spindle assembly checkpoint protein MAD2B-like isoform X2 [Acropora muricata]|uniref:mitotic spindle assembly checkpoint protein MAD2B-like isoform X2 n=1 Tax=Acropora muricata TaxID=159855 RepID=UPI0034E5F931
MGEKAEQAVDLLAVAGGVLCEFLEVAFHLILYVREVYPSVVFERRKKYNVPVQGDVQRVSLVISDKKFQPIERFVFEIGNLEETSRVQSDDNFLLHTEKSLRGFLLKINSCDALLQPIPPGCVFSILVYTKESSYLKLQEDRRAQEFPWVQAEEANEMGKETVMVPLKSTSSGVVKMQLFVEECADKRAKNSEKVE